MQLVEQHGGESTVLTLGPAEADEQLRYAASIGVNKAVLLPIDSAEWDPQRTAAAITSAIQGIESADGPFDLILFGNESADAGNFQVGVRVAYALARPIVNGIKGIEINGDSITARRHSDAGVEVYTMPMPAVLGVKEGINLPRYPTLKGRLGSKKIEVGQVVPQGVLGGQQMVSLVQSAEQASATVMLGNGPEAAPAVLAPSTSAETFAGDPLVTRWAGVEEDGELAAHGVAVVHQVHHDLLADYGPEAWGESVAQAVRVLLPGSVLACGTDRGNEVMAQAAARLDVPFVANVMSVTAADVWDVTRVRWGGSLLETCTLTADVKLLTVSHHAFEAAESAVAGTTATLSVDWPASGAPSGPSQRARKHRPPSAWSARRASHWPPLRWWWVAVALSARPKPSPRWRSWPPCSAVSSVARAPSPTTDGATTPTRWGKPAPASLQISTWPAESRGPSSTGWAQWRRRRSSRSTPTRRPTWSPRPTTR